MIGVDTNLLVRLLTNDDPGQAQRAAKIMESDDIFIPKTVMLETEWVLRHAYGIAKSAIMKGFQKIRKQPLRQSHGMRLGLISLMHFIWPPA